MPVNREAMRRIHRQGLGQFTERVNGLGIGSQNDVASLKASGAGWAPDRHAGYHQRLTAAIE